MAWRQPAEPHAQRFEMTLANSPAGAARVRRELIRFVKRTCLRRSAVDDIETAIGEALANAAEHGRRADGTIRVEARLTESGFEAAVSDDGPGFAPGPRRFDHPPPQSPRGFGLFLMHAVVDEIEIRDDGRTVWFFKRFLAESS